VYIANLGFRDKNQEDIHRGWEMVERNVGRMSALIMDMLFYAKDRSPRRLSVSLPVVTREVLGLYAGRAADLQVKLEHEIAEDLSNVPGEPKDIHSLISNLISNALDACVADESENKAHRVVVRVFPEKNHAVVEVEDNGAGMDEETRGKLFTMFYSTKGPLGTGLGLLVVHKVVTEHGGTVTVKSVMSEGSTFTVRLPLEAREGEEA
jgi:signal transduction histidine kinase